MSGSTSGGWLTVAQASAALGISERQARRYAGRLAPDDRREAGHEAGHMTAALVAQLQAENVFLRGQVEQHARAEAELRAALREALRMSNRALMPAGDDVVQEPPTTSTAPEAAPAQKPARPLWMLLLGWRPGK
jgi:hypothetical protein